MSGPDAFLGGLLRLHQPPKGAHRAGTDGVLLARLMTPAPGDSVCDLGSGPGIVGLACAIVRPGVMLTLVERDPAMAALARTNATLNGLPAEVIEADVLAPGREREAAGLAPETFDYVLTNPPYFQEGRYRPSPDAAKAAAHGFGPDGLEGWIRTCAAILKPGGRLGMIHRSDALPQCLQSLASRFGGITVRPVLPKASEPAIRILLSATKGSRAPFVLEAPLVLHGADGRFTSEADALHRG